ncbi:Tetraspanin-3 [Folsomia candida]|uniref:Tetraspanin-3 n=1 Tax=Folsomia candida TaxID=158441 RepID=A0A226CW45_FOLCA|nr:Tetraspanin-3 [Folsomia candida]
MTEKVTIASQLTKSRGDSNLPTSENARNPTPLPVPNKEPTPSIETSASTSTYPSVSVSSSTFGTTTAYSKLDISERSDSYDYPVLPPVQIVHLSAQNRKIVATNIRHFLVLFWILLFASSILMFTYLSVGQRVIQDFPLFSSLEMMSFLPASIMISCILSLGHILITHFRVDKMGSKIVRRIYLASCVVMLLHYVAMSAATGTEMYLKLSSLEEIMMANLNKSIKEDMMTQEFHSTQRKRRCCGVHGPQDWKLLNNNDWWPVLQSFNPSSCCQQEENSENEISLCTSDTVWPTGCYEVERGWIIWYCGWYIVLLGIGCVLNVLLHLQIHRLISYCKIYRPHWIYPDKPRQSSKTTNEASID